MIAVLGAAGLAIGLALQGSLSNFAAGVMLIVLRPYKVGDLVTIGKYLGRVEAISVFQTIIVTADHREVTIPNGQIIAQPIENLTVLGRRRVDLVVSVAQASDLHRVRAAARRRRRSPTRASSRRRAPTIDIAEITDASVKLYLRPWTSVENYTKVATDTMERIKHDDGSRRAQVLGRAAGGGREASRSSPPARSTPRLAVAAGAFGAHGLRERLEAARTRDLRDRRALPDVSRARDDPRARSSRRAARAPPVGSSRPASSCSRGSLYVLALTDVKILGAITPLGGLAFLVGWAWLAIAALRWLVDERRLRSRSVARSRPRREHLELHARRAAAVHPRRRDVEIVDAAGVWIGSNRSCIRSWPVSSSCHGNARRSRLVAADRDVHRARGRYVVDVRSTRAARRRSDRSCSLMRVAARPGDGRDSGGVVVGKMARNTRTLRELCERPSTVDRVGATPSCQQLLNGIPARSARERHSRVDRLEGVCATPWPSRTSVMAELLRARLTAT